MLPVNTPANPFAYPVTPEVWGTHHDFCGMELRDWLAGQAPVTWAEAREVCGWSEDEHFNSDGNRAVLFTVMGMLRYEYADAMLAARAHKPADAT